MTPFSSPAVEEKFAGYPEPTRRQLMAMRETIFDVAGKTEGVGAVEETLKWGQPSYPTLTYEGVRCVRFPAEALLPEAQLRHIIALTLTHHVRKRES